MDLRTVCRTALIGLAAVGLPAFAPLQRGTPLNFPPSDPQKDIAQALGAAAADGKRVLLDFGADWCPDCKVLEQIFRDPAVSGFLNDHFHLVRIDVGVYFQSYKIKNADIAAKYGLGTMEAGIPALVLLDRHGRVIEPQHPVAWSTASGFTVPEVLTYLTQLAATR